MAERPLKRKVVVPKLEREEEPIIITLSKVTTLGTTKELDFPTEEMKIKLNFGS